MGIHDPLISIKVARQERLDVKPLSARRSHIGSFMIANVLNVLAFNTLALEDLSIKAPG